MEITESLSDLVKDANLELLEMHLAKPNIFSILKIEKVEIRHSNFLAWLLDPSGSHNLNDRVLKWFLKEVFSDQKIDWMDEFTVDGLSFHTIQIYREYKNIDLILVCDEFVIAIENKILSTEHSNQLSRYEEIVKKDFNNKKHAFIYFTLYGDEPEKEENASIYVNYSYIRFEAILSQIVNIYSDILPDKAFVYIQDYIEILRRFVMQDDKATLIAQEIYRNHKEAIDFIIESKPDRLLLIMPIALNVIKKAGYIPGTQNKGFARFLTPEINDIIPRDSINGWKNQELFLFEISMWSKNIVLKTVIAPGNENQRNAIREALLEIPKARNSQTKMWNTIHSIKKSINVMDEKYEDFELLEKDLLKFLQENKDFISSVSKAILAHKSHIENPV